MNLFYFLQVLRENATVHVETMTGDEIELGASTPGKRYRIRVVDLQLVGDKDGFPGIDIILRCEK